MPLWGSKKAKEEKIEEATGLRIAKDVTLYGKESKEVVALAEQMYSLQGKLRMWRIQGILAWKLH